MVKTPIFGAQKLKRWQSWKTLQDYQYDLVCIGDSFTHGSYWTGLFRTALLADGYGDGGVGWMGFGWGGASKALRNTSIDSAILDYDLTEADWTNTYGVGGYGAAVEHIAASAADKVLTITGSAAMSTLKVLYLKSAAGFSYQISGGGYSVAVDTSGTLDYQSDFSAGVDSFSVLLLCTADGNIDAIGGRDNCLRVTSVSGTGRPQVAKTGVFASGQTYNVSAEIYIPSTNTTVDQVAFTSALSAAPSVSGSVVTALDTWTLVSFSYTVPSSGGNGYDYVRWSGLDGGSNYFAVPDGDIFYVRNMQVRTPTADPISTAEIDVSAAGASFTVDLKSTATGTTLLGVIARTSASNALCVHKLGSTGGNAGMFADSTYWDDSVALLTPKGAIIMFGTNEQVGATTPAAYAANIQSIIDKLRVITPSIDILLACPGATKYGNTAATTYPLSAYQAQLGLLAIENDCAYVDFLESIGPWSSQLVTDTFVHGDEVHPGTRGKHVYANLLHSMLT